MRNCLLGIITLVVTLSAGMVYAEKVPFPKTAYEATGRSEYLKKPDAALFVLVDESVGFDKNMIGRSIETVVNWLEPGSYVEISRFSSSVVGRYTETITKGRIDPEPDDDFLDNLKRSELAKFEALHRKQFRLAKQQTYKALYSIIKTSNKSVPHSDIVSSLKYLSDHVRQFDAKRKVVLVISDMLENSSATTFYSKGHIRSIDPVAELKKLRSLDMIGDYGDNVTVYIIGLGYFWTGEGAAKEKYLNPKRVSRIQKFWVSYFKAANAHIGEIGMPLFYGGIE